MIYPGCLFLAVVAMQEPRRILRRKTTFQQGAVQTSTPLVGGMTSAPFLFYRIMILTVYFRQWATRWGAMARKRQQCSSAGNNKPVRSSLSAQLEQENKNRTVMKWIGADKKAKHISGTSCWMASLAVQWPPKRKINMISCMFFHTCACEFVFIEAFVLVHCDQVISEGVRHLSCLVDSWVRLGPLPPGCFLPPKPNSYQLLVASLNTAALMFAFACVGT